MKRKPEVKKNKLDNLQEKFLVDKNMDKSSMANIHNKKNLILHKNRFSKKQFHVQDQQPEEKTNFLELISSFCSQIKTKKTYSELYKCFNSYAAQLGYEYTAICFPNKEQESLNVKTYNGCDKLASFQFSLFDENDILVQGFFDKSRKFLSNRDLYKINCPENLEYLMIPLVVHNDCVGIIVAGSNEKNRDKDEFINTLCNYLSLLMCTLNLKEDLNLHNECDNLTGLYTHKKFNEHLSQTLELAKKESKKTSVLIFDIDNISGINKEFGHTKGDEVISYFARYIKSNIRTNDFAARYGSDEVAVIMHDTDNDTAKIIAETIISNISKTPLSKVGKIEANVGMATYPTSTEDKEKLLVLAEQSMLVSKKKKKEKGNPEVLSSNDIDFWNKTALESLSKVINKRNMQHKFKIEDEIVKQFNNDENPNMSLEVVTSLAAAIDAKDTYTRGHSQAVSDFAVALAKAANLKKQEIEEIKLAAILHDVGKIGISESILRKPGPLTDHEWEVMKQHPIIGVKKILEPIKSLKTLIPAVRHHHERIDGLGYPDKLKGDEIPIGAKIIAIADAFHALISTRPYRKAASVSKALKILKSGAGTQWDADLVEKFILISPIFSFKKED